MKIILPLCLLVMTTASVADPVSDFKALAKQCASEIELKRYSVVFFNPNAQAWVKQVRAKPEVSFDVKKSESLVYPYTAFLQVTEIFTSKKATDQTSAAALEPTLNDAGTGMQTYRVNFRYSDDEKRWTATDGRIETRFKTVAGAEWERDAMKMTLSRDQVNSDRSGISKACVALKPANTTE